MVTHGKPQAIGSALARLANVARESGVELHLAADESEKHGLEPEAVDDADVDIAVVLGGDGTMLRGLARLPRHRRPRDRRQLRPRRLPHLDRAQRDRDRARARVRRRVHGVEDCRRSTSRWATSGASRVNDLVVTSGVVGRMIQLEWAVGGEGLGRIGCDGIVCSTPSGSTGYNFSNGGPVLVWGIDAMAVTFVAPHSLQRAPARRPARRRADRLEPDARRPRDRARRRPPGRRPRSGRTRGRTPRRAALAARDPARGDVLQPLQPDLCFVACASRTSSSSAKASSARGRA